MKQIPETINKVVDKVPTVEQWKKYGTNAVSFIFMLLFVVLFLQDRFSEDSKCADQIKTLERVIADKDKDIKRLNDRVSILEEFIYVKVGVLKEVRDRTESISPTEAGGSK